MHHAKHRDHSTHKNRNDRDQEDPKSKDPIQQHFHAQPPARPDFAITANAK
jgi:hypothetical protein